MHDNRRGFTATEMLVVVLMTGMVASVGVLKFAAMRDTARATTMVDDLRKLAASEEAYLADHGTYYGGEVPSAALPFVPSAGVTLKIAAAGPTGWSATAMAVGTRKRCTAVFGSVGAPESADPVTQATCAR